MFYGSICALVTPFRHGRVDERTFQELVQWQVEQGTEGVVPCGTTGESPTLSHDEHRRVIELCVEVVQGRVPVIAGTGSNATSEVLELTQHAKDVGADAALIVVPYYNKPTQNGIFQHFQTIHDRIDLPIVLYNIPGRCGVDLGVETMAQLAQLPRIVGVKDATTDLVRPLLMRQSVSESFCQLSGEDATVVAFLAHGGHGCISVTANVVPRLCADLHKAWRTGDYERVFVLRDLLFPLHQALFIESNPTPVKYALSLMEKCRYEVRSPLVPPSHQNQKRIYDALSQVVSL